MSKRILNEEQIIDIIWGATLMGGGGGGSMQNGVDLLNTYKAQHPGKPVQVTLYDTAEMDPQAYGAITAGMGAPTALLGVDFSKYATNAFAALKEMAAKMDPPRQLEYSLPVELGGFNTFVPMLISLVNDIPFIDSDGCGRAVPALDTLLLHINGCETSPLAMANADNDTINITLNDPHNAHMGEEIGRYICVAFSMMSGLSGWMLKKDQIEKCLPCGTITLSEKVGHVLRSCAGKNINAFDELSAAGLDCKCLTKGKVVKTENLQQKGFDYGKVYIEGENGKWVVYFQNENLLVEHEGQPVMTVPDITCTYNADTGIPLTNADIKEGMTVYLGAVKADPKWWQNPDMFQQWKPFLDTVGYQGGNIPYAK